MVTDKADYKFVTGLDKIRIDGGIMPSRSDDPGAPGMTRKDAIRGEDIAFAAEAVNELSKVLGVAGSVVVDMDDTRLLHERPRDIASSLSRIPKASSIVCTTATAPTKRGVSTSTPWSLWNNLDTVFADIVEHPQFDSDPDRFYPGAKAKQEDIEDILEDTQKVKAAIAKMGETWNTSAMVWTDVKRGDDIVPVHTGLYTYAFSHANGEGAYNYSGTCRSTVTGGEYRAHLSEWDFGIPFTVKVYAALTLSEQKTVDGGETTTQTFIDVVPIAADFANGVITIQATALVAAATVAMSAHGITELPYVPREETSLYSAQWITAAVHSFAVQRIRGDHTVYEAD